MNTNSRPLTVWILMGLLVFLSLGGFFGGVAFLADPSGASMGLSTDLLIGTPVSDFLLPGLFLLIVMGIGPLIIVYGLWKRNSWVWKTAVFFSLLLIGWIGLQILLWGAPATVQIIFLLVGFMLLGLCFTPTTKQYCVATHTDISY